MKKTYLATALCLATAAGCGFWYLQITPGKQAIAESLPAASNSTRNMDTSDQNAAKGNVRFNTDQAELSTREPESTLTPEGFAIAPETEHSYDSINHNTDYPDLAMRMAEIRARRPESAIAAETVLAQLEKPAAWKASGSPGPNLNLTIDEQYDGRAFLNLDAAKIETLMPGDQLQVPLHHLNAEYRLQIDSVEVHNDGNITWRGHLLDFDSDNYVSITQSPAITVAGITTPQGHHTLESHRGDGWITTTDSLFKIDAQHEDGVIPQPDDLDSYKPETPDVTDNNSVSHTHETGSPYPADLTAATPE